MKNRCKNKFFCCLLAAAMVSAMLFAGCGNSSSENGKQKETAVKLNPDKPVTVTVWHYYNGAQQVAFDTLVKEFNDTIGKEQGIFVEEYSQGNINELEEALQASMDEEVGAQAMPNIFSAYADTAYVANQKGMLADISSYMTEGEMEEYVDSYIEEGRLGKNDEVCIFPTAKSSEIFMLNKTDWDKFAEASGADISELSTLEGVTNVSQAYYEWTDSLTPDIPEDGKAFYGRDSLANLFIIGSRQLGEEIFKVADGKAEIQADKEILKKIWDNYYVPFVKGYFSAYGKFRSDDVKVGELLAFTGSSGASMYFPDQVENEQETYPIDYMVLPAPAFEDGEAFVVQQGAGMAVTNTGKEEEYASVEFLKWFTEAENNIRFCCAAGYLPVKEEACSKETLDKVIEENNLEIPEKTYDVLNSLFTTLEKGEPYTNQPFEGGTQARKVLEYNLSDKAVSDREAVKEQIAGGTSLPEASAPYVSEEAFDTWYVAFCEALQETVK